MGREPMITELSKALEMPVEDLVMTMEAAAEVESLQKSVYQGENSEISLSDKLAHKENPQEKLLNRILLEELLAHLDKRERQLICMRYFQGYDADGGGGRTGDFPGAGLQTGKADPEPA